ncbi:MAG: hypothetical protein QHH26_05775 [Armatimonadota bacterium]|nr:hypothetical protein [Armatimonadota bacterium]
MTKVVGRLIFTLAFNLIFVVICLAGVNPGRAIFWQFKDQDIPEARQPDFDDSSWESVTCGHKWKCRGFAWLRANITIPGSIDGKATNRRPIGIKWNAGNGGEIYVYGRLQSRYDNDHPGLILLTKSARPGEQIPVAVRVFMGPRDDSEGEGEFSECDFVILDAERVSEPFKVKVDAAKPLGRLPRPFAGLSQGGGLPDYEPETATKFKEIGIKWFRMDNVLTNVVKKREDGTIYYDWEDFDRRVDFIKSIGAEPILCLSYMPQPFDIVDNPDRHSRPRDWKEWEDLVYAAVRRCNVERKAYVKYWEVWNESNAGWIATLPGEDLLETYLKLYDASARGVKRADPNALVGGPCNAAGPWNSDKGSAFVRGEDFMRGLMKHCEETGTPLDFITWHEYFHPWTTILDEALTTWRYLEDYPKVKKQVREFMITEWNYAWWHDRPHDNEIGAAWCATSMLRAMIPGKVNKPCFFLAKDWDANLVGSWGMFTRDNKIKPVGNVCRMFNMMAPEKIQYLGTDDEITGFAARDSKTGRITVLIVNFAERYGVPREIELNLTKLPQKLIGGTCKRYLVDKDHSNIFHNRERYELECVEAIKISKGGDFTHTFTLENNAVTLLEFIPPSSH